MSKAKIKYAIREAQSKSKQKEFGIEKGKYPRFRTNSDDLDFQSIFSIIEYAQNLLSDSVDQDLIEENTKTEEENAHDPEPLPDNFIREENGWGLCPVCRKKILKLTSTTKLINFPAYCKSCKVDYMVSWWNIENKDIAYTRYVNNKHYINRADIRSYAMRGTGVNKFLNTNTSSTERVALNL